MLDDIEKLLRKLVEQNEEALEHSRESLGFIRARRSHIEEIDRLEKEGFEVRAENERLAKLLLERQRELLSPKDFSIGPL